MRTALIAGATGLVGRHLTEILINSDYYSLIKVLVRKPLDISSPKLEQIIYDYRKGDKALIKGDDIYCCLGTTIRKAGSGEAFREVDYNYTIELARAGLDMGAKKFFLVSAMGADKNSRIFYNRIKGETEEALSDMDYSALFIFRPSLLLGKRGEFRSGEEIAKILMKLFSFLIPHKYKAIEAEKVARSMYKAGRLHDKGIHIIESGEMQKT